MIRKLLEAIRRKPTYRYKSAVTGRWVSKAYAEANPDTTIRERV